MTSSLKMAVQTTVNWARRLPLDPDEAIRQAFEWQCEYRTAELSHYGLPVQYGTQMNWDEFVSWWDNTAVEVRDSACKSWARGFDADVKLFQDRERRARRQQSNAA